MKAQTVFFVMLMAFFTTEAVFPSIEALDLENHDALSSGWVQTPAWEPPCQQVTYNEKLGVRAKQSPTCPSPLANARVFLLQTPLTDYKIRKVDFPDGQPGYLLETFQNSEAQDIQTKSPGKESLGKEGPGLPWKALFKVFMTEETFINLITLWGGVIKTATPETAPSCCGHRQQNAAENLPKQIVITFFYLIEFMAHYHGSSTFFEQQPYLTLFASLMTAMFHCNCDHPYLNAHSIMIVDSLFHVMYQEYTSEVRFLQMEQPLITTHSHTFLTSLSVFFVVRYLASEAPYRR